MNYIKKCTTYNISAINVALANTLDTIGFDATYITKLTNGAAVVNGQAYSVWTDGKDTFVTPDFMLDWSDGEWSGLSANGAFFTIIDGEPSAAA